MLQRTLAPQGNAIRAGVQPDKQRRRLSIAIVLLFSALIVVLVKDRDYWFGSAENATAAEDEQAASIPSTSAPVSVALPSTSATESANHPVKHSAKHEAATSAAQRGPAGTAAEHVQMASINAPLPATEYPLLTGQTSVQGSVLMQALIAPDGVVEDLRVLSGASILVPAAREAVRQWRFKPYVQNGKPVETQARVTVNFSINVSDTTARVQPSSITADGAL